MTVALPHWLITICHLYILTVTNYHSPTTFLSYIDIELTN